MQFENPCVCAMTNRLHSRKDLTCENNCIYAISLTTSIYVWWEQEISVSRWKKTFQIDLSPCLTVKLSSPTPGIELHLANVRGSLNLSISLSHRDTFVLMYLSAKVVTPTPGIEPGPPAWKAGILTTRPYGTLHVPVRCLSDMSKLLFTRHLQAGRKSHMKLQLLSVIA